MILLNTLDPPVPGFTWSAEKGNKASGYVRAETPWSLPPRLPPHLVTGPTNLTSHPYCSLALAQTLSVSHLDSGIGSSLGPKPLVLPPLWSLFHIVGTDFLRLKS